MKPIEGSFRLRQYLLLWHASLMDFGHNNAGVKGGEFRHCPVGITNGYVMIYMAPPPETLSIEMEMFFNAYDALVEEQSEDIAEASYLAALLHLYFVIIHPYGDGNGRSTRLLELHGLSKAQGFGSDAGPAFAPSDAINRKRGEYYRALQQIQRFPDKDGAIDISPWLEWHTEILIDAIEQARNELKNISTIA